MANILLFNLHHLAHPYFYHTPSVYVFLFSSSVILSIHLNKIHVLCHFKQMPDEFIIIYTQWQSHWNSKTKSKGTSNYFACTENYESSKSLAGASFSASRNPLPSSNLKKNTPSLESSGLG